MFPVEVLFADACGLTIGIFDRSLRYTACYGDSKDLRAVGRVVGELNPHVGGRQVYAAAELAIQNGATSTVIITYHERTYDLRVMPLRLEGLGIVGGIIYGWDVTDIVRGASSM